jgi:hypothetical protein
MFYLQCMKNTKLIKICLLDIKHANRQKLHFVKCMRNREIASYKLSHCMHSQSSDFLIAKYVVNSAQICYTEVRSFFIFIRYTNHCHEYISKTFVSKCLRNAATSRAWSVW